MLKNIKNFVINPYIFLGTTITALFVYIHNKFTLESWNYPLGYMGGDIILVQAIVKNFANFNWLSPLHQKEVPNLNYPDGANWSAWPITEEIPQYIFGLIGSQIGVYPAINFLSLFLYLSAGLSFLYVAQNYKIKLPLALTGAIVFAFCMFIPVRGLAHLSVSMVWHIPIIILICDWAYRKNNYSITNNKYILFIVFCFIFGGFSPYYSAMCCMFLIFALLVHFFRKNYLAIKMPIIFLFTIIFSFCIWNFDTFYNTYLYGAPEILGGRNMGALQIYAMQLPELFYDPDTRRILGKLGDHLFYHKSLFKGEFWSPYLGIIGSICFLFLIIHSSIRLLKGNFKAISIHYFYSIWIILFSLVGGINLLIGTIGFTWLRATNRFSIFLLIIGLIYTLRYLSKNLSIAKIIFISILGVLITYIEFIHPRLTYERDHLKNSYNFVKQEISDDKKLVEAIEQKVPNGKVFQLPVTTFPEFGFSHKMPDYEHLRPFLHAESLSFSYGQVRGRAPFHHGWQNSLSKLSTGDMINEIGLMSFNVILFSKLGYPDEGHFLRATLDKMGHKFIYETPFFVAYEIIKTQLVPAKDVNVIFGTGWSADEKTHRWTNSDKSKIKFVNSTGKPKLLETSFSLNTLKESNIEIIYNSEIIESIDNIIPGVGVKDIKLVLPVNLGINNLEFLSSEKPIQPSKKDKRMLGTMIMNFKTKPISTKNVNAIFGSGWSADEKTHRWTNSDKSKINFLNMTGKPKLIEVTFSLSTLKKSNMTIKYNSEINEKIDLLPGQEIKDIKLSLVAKEGDNFLEFLSSEKPIQASKTDKRNLGTMLIDFKYSENTK